MRHTLAICALAATTLAAFAKEPRSFGEEPGRRGRDGGAPGAAFLSESAMSLAAEYRESRTEEARAALLAQISLDYDAALRRARERVANMEKSRDARIDAAMRRLEAGPDAAGAGRGGRGPRERQEDGARKGRRPGKARRDQTPPPPPEGGEPPPEGARD